VIKIESFKSNFSAWGITYSTTDKTLFVDFGKAGYLVTWEKY